jgi:hypothetical protein
MASVSGLEMGLETFHQSSTINWKERLGMPYDPDSAYLAILLAGGIPPALSVGGKAVIVGGKAVAGGAKTITVGAVNKALSKILKRAEKIENKTRTVKEAVKRVKSDKAVLDKLDQDAPVKETVEELNKHEAKLATEEVAEEITEEVEVKSPIDNTAETSSVKELNKALKEELDESSDILEVEVSSNPGDEVTNIREAGLTDFNGPLKNVLTDINSKRALLRQLADTCGLSIKRRKKSSG